MRLLNLFARRSDKSGQSSVLKGKKNAQLSDDTTYGSDQIGGPMNPFTGMGTRGVDKGRGIRWTNSYYSENKLRTIFRESALAKKIVTIPAEACVEKWREWSAGETETDARKVLMKYEDDLDIPAKIQEAIEDARLFGGSIALMRIKDAPTEEPLNPNMIMEGDLIGLTVFSQESTSEGEYEYNLNSPNYGKPIYYWLHGSNGQQLKVHHTRILRFTAERPMTIGNRNIYGSGWGISSLVSCMLEVNDDATFRSSIASLMAEQSMVVIKSEGVRQLIQSLQDAHYTGSGSDLERFVSAIHKAKSVYDMFLVEPDGAVERLEVTWTGIAQLVDTMLLRVCAAARIPATIFWGQSTCGLECDGRKRPDAMGAANQAVAELLHHAEPENTRPRIEEVRRSSRRFGMGMAAVL